VALELVAPAKLNLTLEVLGRRPDRYHEIASVMQTIDLADRVVLEAADRLTLELAGVTAGLPEDATANLAYRAAIALREAAGQPGLGARIVLEKRIPAGAGLGGGSSDAAAVLRGLNQLWRLRLDLVTLTEIAADLGSDIPFFLHGGAALVRGRGETVGSLPDPPSWECTLFPAALTLEQKTARMYNSLGAADISDGDRTLRFAHRLRDGEPVTPGDLSNAFDWHISSVSSDAAAAMKLCREAGVSVHACGSGPAFFALGPPAALPPSLLGLLADDYGLEALVCRSLCRADSLVSREA
jgi:4-diphosphocytidyl-2-C-methyl-D-erythritol kinase